MKRIALKTTIIAVTFALFSCTSTNVLTIDVLNPAVISFSPDIVNVAIVDNAAVQPDDEGHIMVDFNAKIEPQPASTDTAKSVFKDALAQFMNEENYFNKIDIYPLNIRSDKDWEHALILSKGDISDICQEMDADAVISLDIFMTSSDLVLGKYKGPFNMGFSELKTKMGLSYRIFDKSGQLIAGPIAQIDSAFWNNLERNIPHRDDALKEMALISAENVSKKLIPYWEKQERWYFSDGRSAMKNAATFAKEGKWKEAAHIWGELYKVEKKDQQKIKLASNIALANECLDDIENALEWIRTAASLIPDKSDSDLALMTISYMAQLQKRAINNPKLHTQLGEE